MHQQDHLFSYQLCLTFPPIWMEWGAIRLHIGTMCAVCKAPNGYRLCSRSKVIEHHSPHQTLPTCHTAKPQPIRGFPAIKPMTF